ncbi:hypothetical protein [Streptomyces sp. NPDC085937]
MARRLRSAGPVGDQVRTFGLEDANEAVAYAAAHPGPYDRTVLLPR